MFGLLIDALVMIGILKLIASEEISEFWDVLYVNLGIFVANFALTMFLGPVIGPFVILPMIGVALLAVMYFLHLSLKTSIFLLVFFSIYKVAFAMLL